MMGNIRWYYHCSWGECTKDATHQVLCRSSGGGRKFFLSQVYCESHAEYYAQGATEYDPEIRAI